MGYYINSNSKGEMLNSTGKAKSLIEDGATRVTPQFQPNLICVVSNGSFDAAAYCYSEQEFNEFNDPADYRPKVFLTHPEAAKLSGFSK